MLQIFNCLFSDGVLSSFAQYDSQFSSKNISADDESSMIFRHVTVDDEKQDESTPSLHRTNYALDFYGTDNEKNSRTAMEKNVKEFIDGCIRSSLHEISYENAQANSNKFICFLIIVKINSYVTSTGYC